MAALLNCPSDSGRKQELSKMLMGKQIIIENFGSFLEHMRRSISLVIPSCLEETITTSNMEQYLAELENMIVKACRLEDKVNQSYKDEITNYSRTPPTVSEDIKEMREERLLEPDRLRNYAGDYWERRKNKTRGEE